MPTAFPADALSVLVVRSPHYHARFSFGDLDGFVKDHPGVVAVFTARDIPGHNAFGVIPPFADQPALAESPARFRGEAVALIAGERAAIADLDVSEFPVAWEPQPHALQPCDARADGVHLLHAHRAGNILTTGFVERGDPETAIAEAAVTVSGAIETSYVEHAYIEPEAGFAYMDGDTLVVTACTQAPHMDLRRHGEGARSAAGQGAHRARRDRRRLWLQDRCFHPAADRAGCAENRPPGLDRL